MRGRRCFGCHLVEVVYSRQGRDAGMRMDSPYMTGVISGNADAHYQTAGNWLGRTPLFWGVDDSGGGTINRGLRRGGRGQRAKRRARSSDEWAESTSDDTDVSESGS